MLDILTVMWYVASVMTLSYGHLLYVMLIPWSIFSAINARGGVTLVLVVAITASKLGGLSLKTIYSIMEHNGFEYIDLGLPSGLLWATCNVGAENPTDIGLYFQWGSVIGYTRNDALNNAKRFLPSSYDKSPMIRCAHSDSKTLGLDDDAARFYMGGGWRMPTHDEYRELLDNTHINASNPNFHELISNTNWLSIILPNSGFLDGNYVFDAYKNIRLWTSTLRGVNSIIVNRLGITNGFHSFSGVTGDYGFQIRGVVSKDDL